VTVCEIWPRASQMSVECNFPLQAAAASIGLLMLRPRPANAAASHQ
jgi:hypothetical protein